MNDGYEDLMEDGEDEYLSEPHWWSPSSVLTSGGSAITAFTIAVAGTVGFVGHPVAEALVGLPDGPNEMRERAIVSAMVVLLLLIGVFWLSHRVLLDDDEPPGWARNLAGSSVVIGTIGTVLSIVTIVASLLQSDDFPSKVP